MGSTSSPPQRLSLDERQTLLRLARGSIVQGVKLGTPLQVSQDQYPTSLQYHRGSFVTLHSEGALRGCIGHLEAHQPLVVDVVENAYAAAFRDPRFPPLRQAELEGLDIHVAVLSTPVPIRFGSEQELLEILRPGVDGLILQYGHRKGTFLPSVWEQLPHPADFLNHLKRKTGLPVTSWPQGITALRYETESFS
ncbi:MAG: AmmeMemoRadiSam system protein A [Gammaproteobacteria bacterium]|nr:AmmeMemoRadiSam system protein A [Gammaproteobacteria bacterium]